MRSTLNAARFDTLVLAGFAAVLLLSGCRSRGTTRDESDSNAASTPRLVFRETSYPDPGLAAQAFGRLEIAVRSADRPTESLMGAVVTVRRSDNDPVIQTTADPGGIVRLDTLPAGTYLVRVRRIGYASMVVRATVSDGCRSDLEMYIGVSAVGLDPPPPTSSRATLTACRPAK